MSARPFAEQERELLKELTDLFALRDEQERTLPARLQEGLAAAEDQHRRNTEQARRAFDKALGEGTAAFQTAKARIDAAYDAKLDAATKAMNADLAAFRERTNAMSKAVATKLEDGKWLAETMLESGHGKIRPAFEATKKAIALRTAELDLIETAGRDALARGDCEPLPIPESPTPPTTPTTATTPTSDQPTSGDPGRSTLKDLDGAVVAARDALLRLKLSIQPRLLDPLGVLGMILVGVLVGAGAGGGRGWVDPIAAVPRALAGAGIGFVVVLAVVLIWKYVARRRVPACTKSLHEALVSGRTMAANVSRASAAARDTEIAELKARATREWTDAQASVAAMEAEVSKRYREQEPELRNGHRRGMEQIRARKEKEIAEAQRVLDGRRAVLEAELKTATGGADEELAATRRRLEEAERSGREVLEREWMGRIAAATQIAGSLAKVGAEISPAWDSPVWERMEPAAVTPPGVRFGALRLDMAALPGGLSKDPRLAAPGPTVCELPLLIDLLGKGSVLLKATPETRESALGVLNNIMLRLLTGLPPGKARFTIVDPVGLGQSFAGLMHLSDYEEALVGERIWTDPRHIEQRLTDLTEHMETVIQKYLRNEYQTIQAYNAEAGEVAEPYRFLVIADFPTSITEGAAKRLASIATSGARCGVFLLLMTTQPPARANDANHGAPRASGGVPWAEIERNSMVVQCAGSGARWSEEPFAAWPLELEAPPDEGASTRLLHQIGELAKDSTRVRVPFSSVEPGDGRSWTGETTSEIRLPLGRAGAKKLQYLSLGRGTAQHALIAGRTGSGKSTLLHVIITTAALWYSPDEVELYLVDFKKGVEFKTYATHALPHARVVAVESEREFGLSVLRKLDAELTRRGTLFRDAGVQDVAGFRRWQAQVSENGATPTSTSTAAAATALPRILLIVDEFQEFFVEDDKLAQDTGLLLDRLVRQGRAFGMHVILGSQTLGGAYTLARSTLGQMAVRIALQCSEGDSYLIMSEDNPAARLLSRPGEAIYNDASGLLEGNSPFQVVWLSDDVREARLRGIREKFAATARARPAQIVFEGSSPADIERNHLLAGLIERHGKPGPVPVLYLGEPLAIKDPTGVPLRHQSAANTLIVGNQDEFGAAMLAGSVLSLAAWLAAQGGPDGSLPAITILDATPPDLAHAELMGCLVKGLGGLARLAGVRQVKETIGSLVTEIDRREASGTMGHRPMLLVISGLQRFRELKKSDDFVMSGDAEAGQTPAQMLTRVLRAGPQVGVHALVWCDTATSVERMLERSALREFNGRVLMQMSSGDSTQLIDSPAASVLGRNRALLYSDDTGGIEKFRPYSVPSGEWLEGVMGRVGTSAGSAGT